MSELDQNPAQTSPAAAADPHTTVGGHARITTLSLVDDAGLTKRAPAYDPDKGMANHKAFLRYVRAAFDGATAETLVQAGFGEVADAELGEVWVRYADQVVAPGALSDGSTVLIAPAEGVSASRYLLVDLANRLKPAKSGHRMNRYSRADSVEFRNAGDLLALRTIREDFKAHARLSGSEAAILGDEAIDQFFDKVLSDSRLLTPKRIDNNMPLTYERADIISAASRALIAEAIGLDGQRVSAPTFSPEFRAQIAEAIGVDSDSVAPPPGEAPQVKLSDALAAAAPAQLAAAIAALRATESTINAHYVKMLERTMLSRSYNAFMADTMARIHDVQQQRRYERDIAERDSATVYQQKKHVPESHLEAATKSVFARSGDFTHVEIDESVELELMERIEAEWEVLRDALPHSDEKATLRFRKTGRHKAAGVYHPIKHNIAVDPRHPHSFVHEYFHHLDYTLGADADTRQLSLSEDFADILHSVQAKMRATPGIDKLDYYTTPTEVFARGGELVCFWSGLATSLNGDQAIYDTPVYRSYEPFREQLIAWYNERLGLDIAHERALPAPRVPARPALPQIDDIASVPAPRQLVDGPASDERSPLAR